VEAKVSVSLRTLLAAVIVVALVQIGLGALSFVSNSRSEDAVDQVKADAGQLRHLVLDLRAFEQCQANFNNQFAEVQNPRAHATEQRDAALRRYLDYAAHFVSVSGNPQTPTPAELRRGAKLFHALNDASDHLADVRRANPLPPTPAHECGSTP
jgi:hypothetical protein